MSESLDNLAKRVRTLILVCSALRYVVSDISNIYIKDRKELDDPDHPLANLNDHCYQTGRLIKDLVKNLLDENIIDPYFRRALQKLATMDALQDGDTAFVRFVRENIKDSIE